MNISNPVRLSSGQVIDRSQVAFSMPEFLNHKNYFVDRSGRIYHRKGGTLRRLKGQELKDFLVLIAREMKEDQTRESGEIPKQVRDDEQ